MDSDQKQCSSCSSDSRQMLQEPPNENDGSSDVSLVVARAKKAAASLWMMIHAEGCTNAECPHRSCAETKRLLSHVRSCPATLGFGCPSNIRGCNDAKKLLAHYRRCREIRARMAIEQHLDRIGVARKEHSCLICTFVSRYAKTMLDNAAAANTTRDRAAVFSGTAYSGGSGHMTDGTNTIRVARDRSDSCPDDRLGKKEPLTHSIAVSPSKTSRQRSASCSSLLSRSPASHLTCGGCDTIAEEDEGESPKVFQEQVAEVQ